MTLALTPDELIELTGKRRPTAQARALRSMGIAYIPRPDGTLVVLHATLTIVKTLSQEREPQLQL